MCILYCACSVCAKIKSRKNLKLKNLNTQTFPVIRYMCTVYTVVSWMYMLESPSHSRLYIHVNMTIPLFIPSVPLFVPPFSSLPPSPPSPSPLLHQVNMLLQAYISQLKLEGFALVSDMVYISQVRWPHPLDLLTTPITLNLNYCPDTL